MDSIKNTFNQNRKETGKNAKHQIFTVEQNVSPNHEETRRKTVYNGGLVLACASNLNPARFAAKLAIVKKDGVPFPENQFEKLCNEMLYYNCINAETGKYIRFYTED